MTKKPCCQKRGIDEVRVSYVARSADGEMASILSTTPNFGMLGRIEKLYGQFGHNTFGRVKIHSKEESHAGVENSRIAGFHLTV